MLNRKILAHRIKNLTDARYFAAWMVDYMSFDIRADSQDYIGQEHILEIINWLSGPSFIGDFSGHDDLDFISKICDTHKLEGIVTDNIKVLEASLLRHDYAFYYPSDVAISIEEKYKLILDFKDLAHYKSLPNEKYLNIGESTANELKEIDTAIGFCVSGGEEIKTGLKSFDELDQLYDILLED